MKTLWFDKFKTNAKRLLYEGWVDKPAFIRAFFWFCIGIIFFSLVSK